MHAAVQKTPARPDAPGHCGARVLPSSPITTSALTGNFVLEAHSHGLHTRCLRFVARVTPTATQDSLPAGDQPYPGGCCLRGTPVEVSVQFILFLQASPGARWAHNYCALSQQSYRSAFSCIKRRARRHLVPWSRDCPVPISQYRSPTVGALASDAWSPTCPPPTCRNTGRWRAGHSPRVERYAPTAEVGSGKSLSVIPATKALNADARDA